MRPHLAWGALALALGVAACSSGDGDPERGSPPTVPAATATTRGESTSADNERFCARIRTADELLNRARVSGTPQAVEERYNSAVEAMRAVVDATPERLKKDAEMMARGYDALVDEVRKAGWSLSRVPAGTIERLGTPDMRAAGERLETYERQACGTGG